MEGLMEVNEGEEAMEMLQMGMGKMDVRQQMEEEWEIEYMAPRGIRKSRNMGR